MTCDGVFFHKSSYDALLSYASTMGNYFYSKCQKLSSYSLFKGQNTFPGEKYSGKYFHRRFNSFVQLNMNSLVKLLFSIFESIQPE